jgi:hypothetical protein
LAAKWSGRPILATSMILVQRFIDFQSAYLVS